MVVVIGVNKIIADACVLPAPPFIDNETLLHQIDLSKGKKRGNVKEVSSRSKNLPQKKPASMCSKLKEEEEYS